MILCNCRKIWLLVHRNGRFARDCRKESTRCRVVSPSLAALHRALRAPTLLPRPLQRFLEPRRPDDRSGPERAPCLSPGPGRRKVALQTSSPKTCRGCQAPAGALPRSTGVRWSNGGCCDMTFWPPASNRAPRAIADTPPAKRQPYTRSSLDLCCLVATLKRLKFRTLLPWPQA